MNDQQLDSMMQKYMRPPANKDNSVEEEKIIKKAYNDALYDVLKCAYKRQMVQDLMEGILPVIPKDAKLLEMLQKQSDSFSTKPPYMMVTVNPKEGVTLLTLKKAVDKFVKKKTISNYFYAYEVRKEEEGLHCHIILEYTCKPYEFKRSTKSTFNKICDSNNPNILNFKFLQPDLIEDKIKYLLGHKKDKKMKGVEFSEKYRITNNLDQYYESSPPFPCRATQKAIELSPDIETPETH